MNRPTTSRDLRIALAIWAAMGLTGCGLVDALDDATSTQMQVITGPRQECHDIITITVGTEIGAGASDTTQVCEVAK